MGKVSSLSLTIEKNTYDRHNDGSRLFFELSKNGKYCGKITTKELEY